MNKILAFVCLIVFTFAAQADLKSDLNSLVESYNSSRRFHGNVLVKHKGEVVFEKSVGEAVAEWSVPHTSESKFMIASLSKSFTSAMVLILQNQGKLSIQDLVADYIDLPKNHKVDLEKWNKLKVKDLMNHRGGLKRDFKNSKYLDRAAYNFPAAILFGYLSDNNPFVRSSSPGERFNYSNLGYLMLAEVIETVGVRFYEDQLKNNIFRPLGMLNTGEFHRGKFIENMVAGYHYGERQTLRKRCCDDATSLRGAASLYSTSGDLMLWLTGLQKSNEVFGFDLLGEMMSGVLKSGDGELYGYGLEKIDAGETYRISHTGHEWGYLSAMNLYPEKDLEIVVLANRHELLGFGVGNAIDELSLEIAEFF